MAVGIDLFDALLNLNYPAVLFIEKLDQLQY